MSISMIGVDHNRAPVDIRALFAFTKKNAGEAMERLKEQRGFMDVLSCPPATGWKYGRAWTMPAILRFMTAFVRLRGSMKPPMKNIL